MAHSTRRYLLLAGIASTVSPFLAGSRAVIAANPWPNRPVRLIVPWSTGGVTDVTGRLLAKVMTEDLKQNVIVENKPGGSGTIGHSALAQAEPDGYTILLGTNSTYAMAPHLLDKLPYDNDKAFAPIGLVARSPQILCCHPDVPVKDLPEFFKYVRGRQPDGVTFGSSGPGSSSHLATELLMSMAGFSMVHVPYRGGGPAAQGLMAGEVKVGFVDAVIAQPFSKDGRLRTLGTSTTERLSMLPELPTIAESGVKGFQSSTDLSMFAPAGTPPDLIERINKALLVALKSPEIRKPLEGQGATIIGGSPKDFPAYFVAENKKWGDVIRSRGIKK